MADYSLIMASSLIVGCVIGLGSVFTLKHTKKLGEIGALPAAFSILGVFIAVVGTIASAWSYAIAGAFVFLCLVPGALDIHITLNVFRWLSLFVVSILGYLVLPTMLLRVGALVFGILVGTAGLVDIYRLKTRKSPATPECGLQ